MLKNAKNMNKALKSVVMVHDIFGPLSSQLYIYKNVFSKKLMQ